MAAINFPSSPTNGEKFTSGGKTYTFNGTGWILGYADNTAGLTKVSTTPPTSPVNGDVWIDSNTMTQYAYYNDGDTSQWVEVSATVKPAVASGLFASRPAASLTGQYYFATDTSRLYLDTGTSWQEVASGNGSVTSAMLASGVGGMSLIDSQTFTSSTTYAISSSAKILVIECIGAGGGGASGRSAGADYVASGGGGGGYWRETHTTAEISGTVTVTIGAGGTGAAAATSNGTYTNGGNGGSCRFGSLYFMGSWGGLHPASVDSTAAQGAGTPVMAGSSGFSGGQGGGLGQGNGGKGWRGGGGGGAAAGAGGSVETDPNNVRASSIYVQTGSTLFGVFPTKNATGGGAAGGAANSNGSNATTAGHGGGSGNGAGKNGGSGAAPGGGGGGAGTATNANSGTGGNGGAGQIKVWVYG